MDVFPSPVVFAVNDFYGPQGRVGFDPVVLHKFGDDLKRCAMMMEVDQILIYIILEGQMNFPY